MIYHEFCLQDLVQPDGTVIMAVPALALLKNADGYEDVAIGPVHRCASLHMVNTCQHIGTTSLHVMRKNWNPWKSPMEYNCYSCCGWLLVTYLQAARVKPSAEAAWDRVLHTPCLETGEAHEMSWKAHKKIEMAL